jgi:hypothetical protein
MDVYPSLNGSQLDDLPSQTRHCGACHFDFSGGGARNPYGLAIEVGRANGMTTTEAVLAIEGDDTDGDGFSNLVEITDLASFSNTPTFPGLSAGNLGSVSNIPIAEIDTILTPSGGTDTTPPVVVLSDPLGGEFITPNQFYTINFTATDDVGVAKIEIYLSDDSGTTFEHVAVNQPNTGTYSWYVPNMPGALNRIRVEAYDFSGNEGTDDSPADFTIDPFTGGRVPTTLRDVKLPGTQPFDGVVLDDVEVSCMSCHAGYDTANEPGHTWRGTGMGQSARDPIFLANMAIAEQDAPAAGDLCIRCHMPGGWMEGRSVDTGGGLLTDKDRQGMNCDFCHRLVDYNYVEGVSPPQDQEVLSELDLPPTYYGNAFYIAGHDFAYSQFFSSSDFCGTCHDVSNPVFVKVGPDDYAPNNFNEPHPDFDIRNMLPIERTYSEWLQSEYAFSGVFAPEFAGNKPDGIVSSCQDCHMKDVFAKGCSEGGVPKRTDLPLHDLTGGNTFIQDVIPVLYPGEVDAVALADSKARTIALLGLAGTLELTPETYGLTVRVYNQTGHKLPTGYPEGRRVWLNVKAVDGAGNPVLESGKYDAANGILFHDQQAKIYEIHPGLSPGLAGALGLPAGPSFHFVLNDTVYDDNRIPPRGFTNAAFDAVQAAPVGHHYDDGQYWDDTPYFLPATAETATVTLYYQTISKEFVEFLRDENTTTTHGQTLYDAWVAQGKSPPTIIAQATTVVNVSYTGIDDDKQGGLKFALAKPQPNPFARSTRAVYYLPAGGEAQVEVFDLTGRRVSTLVDEWRDAGRHEATWNGRDDQGRRAASGIYFMRLKAGIKTQTQRVVLIK